METWKAWRPARQPQAAPDRSGRHQVGQAIPGEPGKPQASRTWHKYDLEPWRLEDIETCRPGSLDAWRLGLARGLEL